MLVYPVSAARLRESIRLDDCHLLLMVQLDLTDDSNSSLINQYWPAIILGCWLNYPDQLPTWRSNPYCGQASIPIERPSPDSFDLRSVQARSYRLGAESFERTMSRRSM